MTTTAIAHGGTRQEGTGGVVIVRPDSEVMSRQALPYYVGISAASAGAQAISMNLVVIPAGGEAEPHLHRGYETSVYLLSGELDVRFGPSLLECLVMRAGDFLYLPPDMPHQPVNRSADTPAFALVARNDGNEQESVELIREH